MARTRTSPALPVPPFEPDDPFFRTLNRVKGEGRRRLLLGLYPGEVEVARIDQALSHSRTWGEFRAAMEPAEYERPVSLTCDDEERERPAPETPFRAEELPGYCDGDYPPWLQQEVDDVLPWEVIERFAEHEPTCINGWYVRFDPDDLPAITEMLAAMRIDVVVRHDLPLG